MQQINTPKQNKYQRYYQRHRERLKAKKLAEYHADPEPKKAKHRDWLKANPEKCAEYEARTQRDPELRKISKQHYVKRHPDRRRASLVASNNRRRAQKLGLEAERFFPIEIFERDHWVCHLCGEPTTPDTASLDHIIPLAHGGPHTRDNVATAHRICNSLRWAKPLPAAHPSLNRKH